ncbi:MAG: sodium ion-translocating decarboxylase subunit beta [Deltaproteobacteria bacterium]|nr:sodium ion-translocating decarboxylase subunit beta [Deltaproteobacteria bacterium]
MLETIKDLLHFFPGLESFALMSPEAALVRIALICVGFALVYLGYKRVLDPLLMVPMGMGISMVNAGILLMPALEAGMGKEIGTMFVNPLVSTVAEQVDAFQVYFLQPIYTLTFANGLIACLVFMGIGSITDLDFFISNPRLSMLLAIPAELGTILTFPIATAMGFTPSEAAAIAVIGGADGPMVLFASLQLARHLFVPITIVAYIYLSIIYAGYPFLIKAIIPKKMRGQSMNVSMIKEVSPGEKLAFSVVTGTLLCLLFPVAAPLFASFFLGVAVKESNLVRFIGVSDNVILSGSTLVLGFTLGCLLSANVVMDPKMLKLIILGFIALFLSGLGGLLGGVVAYKVSGGKINPLIGIAGQTPSSFHSP